MADPFTAEELAVLRARSGHKYISWAEAERLFATVDAAVSHTQSLEAVACEARWFIKATGVDGDNYVRATPEELLAYLDPSAA
jgi:hypothetical protein